MAAPQGIRGVNEWAVNVNECRARISSQKFWLLTTHTTDALGKPAKKFALALAWRATAGRVACRGGGKDLEVDLLQAGDPDDVVVVLRHLALEAQKSGGRRRRRGEETARCSPLGWV